MKNPPIRKFYTLKYFSMIRSCHSFHISCGKQKAKLKLQQYFVFLNHLIRHVITICSCKHAPVIMPWIIKVLKVFTPKQKLHFPVNMVTVQKIGYQY